MSDFIVMPKELTAENGAKSLMIGEFKETITIECTCAANEIEDCEVCGDTGEYLQEITVSWSTIKGIYKKAVEHFGVIPSLEEQQKQFELCFACVEFPSKDTFGKFTKNGKTEYLWKRINDSFLVYQMAKGYL